MASIKTIVAASFIALGAIAGHAFSTSYYTTRSLLASNKWVRVEAEGNGIHQITYDQLREWGFANPESVNVYGYGGLTMTDHTITTSMADDVKLTWTLHDGDKIFFYAEGDVKPMLTSSSTLSAKRNPYSAKTYYMLSDRTPAASELKSAYGYSNGLNVCDTHYSIVYLEEDLQNPVTAGAVFLGENLPLTGERVYFDIPVRDAAPGNSTYRVVYGAANLKDATTVIAVIPSTLDATKDVQGVAAPASAIQDNNCRFRIGSTTVTVYPTMADGTYKFGAKNYVKTGVATNATFVAVDNVHYIYPRTNILHSDEASLSMHFLNVSPSYNFRLRNASPTTHALNVTDPANVTELALRFEEDGTTAKGSFNNAYNSTARPSCNIVAFDTRNEQLPVQFAGNIANQNLHGMAVPQMVIITTKTLLEQAEELARIHREHDGLDVAVVLHDLIYNEFGGGIADATAYRRFLKMLYDRDPSRLRSLLLYGPASYDPRGIQVPERDRLLTYETTNTTDAANFTRAFASDLYFAMLGDSYNHANIGTTPADLAVGRIPAPSAAEAKDANAKIRRYLANPPAAHTHSTAVMISDDGNNNSHFDQTESLIDMLTAHHEPTTAVRCHNLVYQWDGIDARMLRDVVKSALQRGAGYFSYVGHAGPTNMGREKLWDRNSVLKTNYTTPPFTCLSTCDTYPFDHETENIAESMVYQPNGGSSAVIASGRTVFSALNQVLALNVARCYATAKPGTTTGSIWRDARNNLIGTASGDTQINTLCYNLCGDPELPVSAPLFGMELTKLDGTSSVALDLKDTIRIAPMRNIPLEGRIVNADGATATAYTGTATITVYDAPYITNTSPRDPQFYNDPVESVTLDHTILATKQVAVENGVFATTILLPVPVHEHAANRITLHADNAEGQRAAGIFKNAMIVTPALKDSDELPGTEPAIETLYVNNPENADGALLTSPDITIIATGTVSEAGLCVSDAIGSGSSLVLDGATSLPGAKEAISTAPDGTWTLRTSTSDISDGHHTLTLTVADNAGRRSSRTVSFTLVNRATATLMASPATTTDEVTFELEHGLDSEPSATLIVEDRLGNTVLTVPNVTLPYTWTIPADLPDGHYTALVKARTTNNYTSTEKAQFVVVKKLK